MVHSLNKGKNGERDFSAYLRERGLTARRGQQFSGGPDSPDVICEELDQYHFEVKRVEKGNPYVWLRQACEDAGDNKIPIVAHRKNREDWIAVIRMGDLLDLMRRN